MKRITETLQAKDLQEVDDLSFDFTDALAAGETIASAVVTCEVQVGEDANPSAMLVSTASVQSPKVVQRLTGGVAEATYRIRCVATLSSGRKLTVAGLLPVLRL